MKRMLAIVVLMMAAVLPLGTHAQNQVEMESIDVPFLILVDNEFSKSYEGGCRFNTERQGYPTLEAAPTPYGPLSESSPSKGRFVTAEQSPISGTEGCLFEIGLRLDFAEKYDFQLIVHAGSSPSWIIDMGEMTFGEIIGHAPDPIIYHFDEDTFATGMDEHEPVIESKATPTTSSPSTITLLIMITDDDLWKEIGAGCVGDGEAEWMNGNTSILIGPAGSTEGIQSNPLGGGSISADDSCSWTVPKTPPIEDNGSYQIIIGEHEVECLTEDMADLGEGYFAALSVDKDGLHCATISSS